MVGQGQGWERGHEGQRGGGGTGREGLKRKKVKLGLHCGISCISLSRGNDKASDFLITKEQEWVGLGENVKL